MQVSVEKNDLECTLTVGLDRTQINEAIQTQLKKLARTTRINGFRPGKVPLRIIKQRFGMSVRQEILGEMMQSSFQEALEQEKLRPAGTPSIEFAEDDGKSEFLDYAAKFELYPEITNVNLDGINIEKATSEVGDEDIEGMLEKLRTQRATWETLEDVAADGDRVIIDYSGVLEGETEPFEGGHATDEVLDLGSHKFITGFEDGLIGYKAGETVSLNLTFPEKYQSEALSGKAVVFNVTVNEVRRSKLPEMNAEFIQSLGVESGKIADLHLDVRENMERELTQKLQKHLKSQVTDALLKVNDIKIPVALVEADAAELKTSMENDFSRQGIDPAQLKLENAQFMPQAEKRVKLGLLMGVIINQQSLTPDAEKVRLAVEDIASSYEDPDSVREWFLSKPENLRDVEGSVLEDSVVTWVLSQVTVTDVSKPFSDIMNDAEKAGA